MSEAVLCKTKAGKGLKIIVNDTWYYCSLYQFWMMMKGKSNGCHFQTIEDDEEPVQATGGTGATGEPVPILSFLE